MVELQQALLKPGMCCWSCTYISVDLTCSPFLGYFWLRSLPGMHCCNTHVHLLHLSHSFSPPAGCACSITCLLRAQGSVWCLDTVVIDIMTMLMTCAFARGVHDARYAAVWMCCAGMEGSTCSDCSTRRKGGPSSLEA